jgi:lysine-N-methylase
MPMPIRHLPVFQNWDCHVCGSCCKEYLVSITPEEKARIEAQSWEGDEVLGGRALFRTTGPFWSRREVLNHREDGSCVFLSETGRCRIHERFGYEAKPLPCRLFPFVLVPAGDHWRVGLRFACPSTAANKGRNIPQHADALRAFANELAIREGLDITLGRKQRPPLLQKGQRVDWADVFRFVQLLVQLMRDQNDRIERRVRKCVALAELCRKARFDQVTGTRLGEFLHMVRISLDAEVPVDPVMVEPPRWIGHLLFRQAVALFTRKDHGPSRGEAQRGRLALLMAAWRFARGRGAVPRLYAKMSTTTFADIENTRAALTPEAEKVLERYYVIKLESLQFCGAAQFGIPFWEGLELLCLTLPILLWSVRALHDLPPEEAVCLALTVVDDHFGFNRVLKSRRQRVGFSILSRTGELNKLIAWYGR